jgi:hypothetical protein
MWWRGKRGMADLAAARRSLSTFSEIVTDHPLTDFQARSLTLDARITAIVAPRQSGKSRSMSLLALWWAFRMPDQRVLVVSAGDEAAKRLLAQIRAVASDSALLRGSVVDETAGLLTLSNGSEIRSVPASERQIRGWTVDLLLIDEAAIVSDDLILGAAFPTTSARPDARIVLASSATTASGAFYDAIQRGLRGDPHVAAFSWPLAEAWWISPSTIEAARASMSPIRFAAEYEGVFASSADSVFPRHVLDAATAPIVVPGFPGLAGPARLLGGMDWGATTDRSAIAAIARLQQPAGAWAVVAAHAWPSGTPLDGPGGVIGQVAASDARWQMLTLETNGLGLPCSQELRRRLHARSFPDAIRLRHTTADMKSAAYSALRLLLEQGRLILPASCEDLLRELLLLRVALLPSGNERIEAGSGHDDLADALMLAAGPTPPKEEGGSWSCWLRDATLREPLDTDTGWADGVDTVTTGAGMLVPRVPGLDEMPAGQARGGGEMLTRGVLNVGQGGTPIRRGRPDPDRQKEWRRPGPLCQGLDSMPL